MNNVIVNNIHQDISNQIIDILGIGIAPWHHIWTNAGIPTNILSGRAYKGINLLLLAALRYQRNYFITHRQIERIGAFVLPGECPHMVVDGNSVNSLRPYEVYNIGQCGNISKSIIPDPVPRKSQLKVCREIIGKMSYCPKLTKRLERAFYRIEEDVINIPPPKSFPTPSDYFAALFRQLIACTAHPSRTDRSELVEFSKFDHIAYSLEELIWEIGTWQLKSYVGIESRVNYSPGYIQHWLKVILHQPQFVLSACFQAQRAVEYVLGMDYNEISNSDYIEDELLPF